MVFSSILFLLYFLPVFLLAYHLVPTKAKNFVFLLFSLLFYAWGAPDFFFILMLSIGIDYILVKYIARTQNALYSKLLLSLVFIKSFGLLFYFKYANFFVENLNEIIGNLHFMPIEWKNVLLPIGISFYTFQSITYAMDVYKKKHNPLQNPLQYYLYIMAFPQMIAGPIVPFHQIADYIPHRTEKYTDKIQGFYRFCIGLGKKVFIANILSEFSVYMIENAAPDLPYNYAWVGMLAYTFQIYFDFSGYSDMALGLGQMLGFPYPENFNNPYTSKSISEFWRKWHITLGNWMKTYLYIPLGGNQKGEWRTFFNLWLVFLLSGLWHGDAWNFVLWGAFHGVLLVLERWFLSDLLKKIPTFLSVLYTFFMVLIGWTLFCSEDLQTWGHILDSMFSFENAKPIYISPKFYIALGLGALFSFWNFLPFGQRIQNALYYPRELTTRQLGLRLILSICILLLSISQFAGSSFNPFIYYRF